MCLQPLVEARVAVINGGVELLLILEYSRMRTLLWFRKALRLHDNG